MDACKALEGLDIVGEKVTLIWAEIRKVVQMGTKCKKPANVNETILPLMKPVEEYMSFIGKSNLDRKYSWHKTAIMEMLTVISWIIVPTPVTFVKDRIGSTDFWTNKIRKEYKGKDPAQIAFADTMKALILDLSAYCKEYHLSGLMWNPHGIPVTDYVAPAEKPTTNESSQSAVATTTAAAGGGAAMADLVNELAKKKTSDGTSAATGLRKVTREQQTWRKEFKEGAAPVVPVKKAPTKTSATKTSAKPRGPPVCEYQSRGFKWVIENQTKETNPNGVCTVTVKDSKEQAYIYRCENATIVIKGKIKSIIADSCTRCNVVFDSAISACEIVNCKSVQVQTLEVCPSFSIDKTDGCLIYLSKESLGVTNFVTSKSSEMNVSWVDEASGDQKEAPIPEQFVHKFVNGSITSEVSDLYH